ncbi:MAG: hypothetical protein ACRDV1_11725 [Actinomycetes bacterium]
MEQVRAQRRRTARRPEEPVALPRLPRRDTSSEKALLRHIHELLQGR